MGSLAPLCLWKLDYEIIDFDCSFYEALQLFNTTDGIILSLSHISSQMGHMVYVKDFKIQNRLVTNLEYINFIEDEGYTDYRHWLADGWEHVQNNNWEQVAYLLLMEAMGFKKNGAVFKRLAQVLPHKILVKQTQLIQVEALLFGQAGFL